MTAVPTHRKAESLDMAEQNYFRSCVELKL